MLRPEPGSSIRTQVFLTGGLSLQFLSYLFLFLDVWVYVCVCIGVCVWVCTGVCTCVFGYICVCMNMGVRGQPMGSWFFYHVSSRD